MEKLKNFRYCGLKFYFFWYCDYNSHIRFTRNKSVQHLILPIWPSHTRSAKTSSFSRSVNIITNTYWTKNHTQNRALKYSKGYWIRSTVSLLWCKTTEIMRDLYITNFVRIREVFVAPLTTETWVSHVGKRNSMFNLQADFISSNNDEAKLIQLAYKVEGKVANRNQPESPPIDPHWHLMFWSANILDNHKNISRNFFQLMQ